MSRCLWKENVYFLQNLRQVRFRAISVSDNSAGSVVA